MKYFTKDLLDKLNSESPDEEREAETEWDRNLKAYWEEFALLKNRLSKETYEFLKDNSFHDNRLVGIELVHGKFGAINPIAIHVVVTNEIDTWRITYEGIEKIVIDFQCEKTPFAERRGFDVWLYDELLVVDENTLSHEIMFGSDATLLVHFKNQKLSITREK